MLNIITLSCQPADREIKEKSTETRREMEYDAFVGTLCDCVTFGFQLNRLGLWGTYGSYIALQRVLVELPKGVRHGYSGLVSCYFGEYDAHDGNRNHVPVHVGKPASLRGNSDNFEAAFAEALDSGIFFDVPLKDGGRRAERVKVLKVGEVVDCTRGETWPKGAITLTDIREAAGLTMQQLADAAGMPVQTLWQIENGKLGVHEAGKDARKKLAAALNLADPYDIN